MRIGCASDAHQFCMDAHRCASDAHQAEPNYFTCKLTYKKSVDNVKLLFYLFCNAESSGVALIRMTYSFSIKNKIGIISKLFDKCYSKSKAEFYNLGNDIKNFKKIMNIYLGSAIATIIFFILDPLLTLVLTGKRTFGNLSPFDESVATGFFYPLALFWTIWQFTTLIATILGVELQFYNGLMVTILEFREIKKDFEEIMKSSNAPNEMKKLIKRHNELFENVRKLENAFSFPLFCNFYSTVLLICFTAFQASTSTDAAELIGMAYFCISSLFQLFVQTYFGDLLKTVSEDVISGIYESNWENSNNMTVRRELPFIIRRARKPAKLTVMKFADITLDQFVNVSSN
ncbi:hypothetical protein PVAND_010608 [Polypedilum vanderplanki]|uniref:Odorant receptor n=1 Tax=Polypedilum vanderplanki TaxID=319348 RepID=A0A9J6CGH0_POLVA|nr:hypothetical protein PVAND_010608 [Polypedilum vanderplanki]